MLLINSYYIMGAAVNTTLIAGVFRAGGDSRFGMICDTIDMWCYAVPLGFLAAAVRIPMTAIVIVAEISGNHGLLLPAMWVCGIAFWLNDGWSLYRSQPHNRWSSQVHGYLS